MVLLLDMLVMIKYHRPALSSTHLGFILALDPQIRFLMVVQKFPMLCGIVKGNFSIYVREYKRELGLAMVFPFLQHPR